MGPNRPDTGFIWTDLAGDGQVHATGSQTEVGSSENAISYQLKPGAKGNYNIIGEHVGTLTVTAQSIAPDPQNPDSYKGVATMFTTARSTSGLPRSPTRTATSSSRVAITG